MCDYRSATAVAYPTDCIAQRRPFMGGISRFAFDQILLEYRLRIFGIALLNQKTRKMHAPQQLPIPGMAASSFKTAVNSELVELCRDVTGAHRPAIANGGQAEGQLGMFRIYAKPDNVQGLAAPIDGNFNPVDKGNICLTRSPARFVQPAHIVMIGQRQDVNPARNRMLHQLRGCQQAVGNRGMAMKINIEHEAGSLREARGAS